jgi:nickel transport system substrate-binding protein
MSKLSRRQFHLLTAATGIAALGWNGSAWAQDGDVLRIALNKPADNLDPHKYIGVWSVQSMVFDPLVAYGQGGKIEPALAESWTESEDGKTITFKLRQNVTFSDGTAWDANALKWNFDRWITDPDNGWLSVGAFYDKLEIIDPLTVALHFKQPVPPALAELSIVRPVRFLSPASVGADGAYKEPIGTGPWVVASSDDSATVLLRNEKYWGEKPAFSRVELKVIPDSRSRVSALMAGDLDIIGGDYVARLSPQEAGTLRKRGIAVEASPGTGTFLLGYNPDREILHDARVREAISIAVDRELVAKALLAGYADPAIDLFSEAVPMAGTRHPIPKRDTERAKALLQEAGWTGDGVRAKDGVPLKLELVVSEEAAPGSRALAEVLQGMLQEVGIEMSIRSVDHATRHDDIPARKYDLAFFTTIGAPYDPQGTLTNYFLSTIDSGTDGKIYLDKEGLDPLINAAMAALGEERPVAFQRVYDWLYERHALAALIYPQRMWAYGPRVQGFVTPPTEYDMPFKGISLKS